MKRRRAAPPVVLDDGHGLVFECVDAREAARGAAPTTTTPPAFVTVEASFASQISGSNA